MLPGGKTFLVSHLTVFRKAEDTSSVIKGVGEKEQEEGTSHNVKHLGTIGMKLGKRTH